MKNKKAGAGEMPASSEMEQNAKIVQETPVRQDAPADETPQMAQEAQIENAPSGENAPIEVEGPSGKQPEFRVVQPEYSMRDNKTIFKDVGALWKNVSQKTGREFYTLKIGKMRLLVFPNQKMAQQQ